MQKPRRPTAERGRGSGSRDRPVSWSRRMEEAREARARVLAARETQAEGEPDRTDAVPHEGGLEASVQGGPAGADEPAVAAEDEPGAARRGTVRVALPWRIAGGVLAGATAGAIVVWALLPGEQTELSGATVGDIAPTLAEDAPPEPQPHRTADAPSAGPDPAVEVAATDGEDDREGAADAAGPSEVSAADMARAAARRAAETETLGAAVDAVPEVAGTEEGASRDEVSAAADRSSDTTARPDAEPARPARTASAPPPGESTGRPAVEAPATAVSEGDAEGASEPGGDPGGGEIAISAALPETAPLQASEAAPETDAAETAEIDVSDALTDAEPEAAVPLAEPEPQEDPPQPPEVVETAAPAAANGTPPQDTAAPGVGLLFVHAAPRVTSEELADVVEGLSEAGFAVEQTRRVDFRISQTNVRYFHDADADLAAGVAETVSGVSRDFTTYEPSPDPGTIEVWLEG